MQHWNWGIPVSISEPSGASPQPLGWHLLKFNQVGLFDIRRRIGVFAAEPGVYNRHRAQFDAADLAWFAAGLSTDVLHLAQNVFPPEFNILRQGTPSGQAGSLARAAIRIRIQKLTFDLAALWDRTFGGATLILHVEGATRPNAPRLPEYIKSDVYFPGYLIDADPRFSPIISELVQKFVVDIGIPVIERWEQCARSIWPLTQGAGGQIPPPYPSQPVQPHAIPRGSSTFVYTGRQLSSDQPGRVVVVDDDEYEEDEISQSMLDMIDMTEERDTYKAQLDAVQYMLSTTEAALSESLAREEELRSELNNANVILSTRLDGNDSNINVNVSRRQIGSANRHGSPTTRIAHHTSPTPRITPHISRITSPTPASRHGNLFSSPSRASPIGRRLFVNPSSYSEGPSESGISAPTPPELNASAAINEFLNTHQLTRLRPTLDLIRSSIPISLWALPLENAGVPLDLIDSVMVLMAASGEV